MIGLQVGCEGGEHDSAFVITVTNNSMFVLLCVLPSCSMCTNTHIGSGSFLTLQLQKSALTPLYPHPPPPPPPVWVEAGCVFRMHSVDHGV
jgi:hypothetical protein